MARLSLGEKILVSQEERDSVRKERVWGEGSQGISHYKNKSILYSLCFYHHEYFIQQQEIRIYFITICIHSFIVLCGLDLIPFYILSSAILYLNGDFEGGDFFFASRWTSG